MNTAKDAHSVRVLVFIDVSSEYHDQRSAGRQNLSGLSLNSPLGDRITGDYCEFIRKLLHFGENISLPVNYMCSS